MFLIIFLPTGSFAKELYYMYHFNHTLKEEFTCWKPQQTLFISCKSYDRQV